MSAAATILVVDDDIDLCRMIAEYLGNHDFAIECCHNGSDAITRIQRQPPDLVILDLMLPGVDGLGVCREVRGGYRGQILMLTALDDQADEISGLELGADDYLTKPVSPRLLLARVRTLLRRNDVQDKTRDRAEPNPTTNAAGVIQLGDLVIDQGNREVSVNGESIRMTTTEFDLLWLLASHAGQPLSREDLHERMYRLELEPNDRRIDLLISRLRRKLGDDTADPDHIKTIRGRGYQMGTGR